MEFLELVMLLLAVVAQHHDRVAGYRFDQARSGRKDDLP
jgi:hypothetical protein